MAESGLKDSPDRRSQEADSSVTGQSSGNASRGTSRAGFERQNSAPFRAQLSTIRSPNPHGPVSPSAPRTPIFNRSISSPFASPRTDFSASDETLVLEFGSRYLRIGIGGERRPRCVASFGPSTTRRAGDYTRFQASNTPSKIGSNLTPETWGQDHELWQMDLRHLDLSLVKDKIERAVRDAMTQHVLILDDSRKRLQMVAVPSNTPQPLLTTVLEALFSHSPSPPSICLITTPVLCLVSAGLRSGLVIDIGWNTTTITAVYEYREVKHAETTRAMKTVHWELAGLLGRYLPSTGLPTDSATVNEEETQARRATFDESEDILYHLAWCHSKPPGFGDGTLTSDRLLSVPLRSSPATQALQIPFETLSRPVETALFATSIPDPHHNLDDDNLPIPLLAYRTLSSLPLDVRSQLVPRIVITGGGASIPGLKKRILFDIENLIKDKAWDPVHNYGSIEAKVKSRKAQMKTARPIAVANESQEQDASSTNAETEPSPTAPTYLQSPPPDPILASIQSRTTITLDFEDSSVASGTVRGIETMGAWAGASLMAGLRVKGAVEIERERFLQHGLLGAVEREDDAKSKRQSVMPGQIPPARPGERHSGNWSLGVFG